VLVLETERLRLRKLSIDDAEFILGLLNEPSFIQYIGDKHVRTLDDARMYLLNGPIASYQKFGFGLYLVELKVSRAPIGICGLLKRDALEDADLGYALIPEFWSQGYGLEAAAAVKSYADRVLGLKRVVAITSTENQTSIRLLEKIGFKFETMVKLADDQEEVMLFGSAL
jgi:RimJ/RimL family protein N-acetyltransferase